jgi:hypothetical protein
MHLPGIQLRHCGVHHDNGYKLQCTIASVVRAWIYYAQESILPFRVIPLTDPHRNQNTNTSHCLVGLLQHISYSSYLSQGSVAINGNSLRARTLASRPSPKVIPQSLTCKPGLEICVSSFVTTLVECQTLRKFVTYAARTS